VVLAAVKPLAQEQQEVAHQEKATLVVVLLEIQQPLTVLAAVVGQEVLVVALVIAQPQEQQEVELLVQ
jgi:hypothetical protein